MRGLRALIELTDDTALRVDDVLGLRSDAVLKRETSFGTDRASCGAYERHFLQLWVFGADGLLTRLEWFAADRAADALARFDELTDEVEATAKHPSVSPLGKGRTKEASPPPAQPVRRVRANAATANAVRAEAAIAARDGDAFPTLFADNSHTVNHSTGIEYDREGALITWLSVMRAKDLTYRLEPLATLGNSLALCRQLVSASGVAGEVRCRRLRDRRSPVIEVDAQGRRQRGEWFAGDRLGDAIARLYERYAELLPDGP